MKRLFDFTFAAVALLVLSPLLLLVAAAIYFGDFGSPFYIAGRVGQGGRVFPMVKFRSMVANADKAGGTSTAATDRRITPVGRFVRRFKFDELLQLWNVLLGDMSLVGPRPNVPSGVAVYTAVEKRLLDVRPGITDFSSIVFADEGEILAGHPNPDDSYDRLIRPWKSRLGLFYIDHQSLLVDLRIVLLTALSIVARSQALKGTHDLLLKLGAPSDLARVALRRDALVPGFPPGAEHTAPHA